MKRGVLLVSILAASLIFFNVALSSAQEKTIQPQATPGTEPDMQWLWGEIVSVNADKSELMVKYLDYEADIEKDMAVGVDEKTTYENVKSINELKPQDTVSIDYITVADGKALAKNISVEKPETAQPVKEEAVKDEPKAVSQEKPMEPLQQSTPQAQPEANLTMPEAQPKEMPQEISLPEQPKSNMSENATAENATSNVPPGN